MYIYVKLDAIHFSVLKRGIIKTSQIDELAVSLALPTFLQSKVCRIKIKIKLVRNGEKMLRFCKEDTCINHFGTRRHMKKNIMDSKANTCHNTFGLCFGLNRSYGNSSSKRILQITSNN